MPRPQWVKIVSSILQFWLLDSRCFLCVCRMCFCAYVHKRSRTYLSFSIPCNSAFLHSLQFFLSQIRICDPDFNSSFVERHASSSSSSSSSSYSSSSSSSSSHSSSCSTTTATTTTTTTTTTATTTTTTTKCNQNSYAIHSINF